jgi:hypothetical protein
VPLSAATTVLLRQPLPVDLAITVALLAGWAAIAWPYLGRRKVSASTWGWAALFAAVGFGFAVWQLWNPYFRGFPSIMGGDGGNHIALSRAVAAGHPEVYEGMASLSVTALWIERLAGTDPFATYRAIFYLIVAVPVVFMAILAAVAGARALGFVVLAVVAYLPATRVILPLLHYYQCDGYWSQLMGLVPLYLGLGLYATARRRGFRLLALAFTVGFYRFTYLLNISDLLVAVAAMTAWEIADRGTPRWFRVTGGLGAVVLAGAAALAAARIYAVAALPGGIVENRPILFALGILPLAALLIAAPLAFRAAGAPLEPPARR